MTEERDDIVVLIDEEGKEVDFEIIDFIEVDKKEYVILLPLEEVEVTEELETEEIIILRVEHEENGEDSYVTVEDEKEELKVFEEFKKRKEEEYDFDE